MLRNNGCFVLAALAVFRRSAYLLSAVQNSGKKYGPNLSLPFRDMGGEKLLQFIWQFGYFNASNLFTTGGEAVAILFSGSKNNNGGPDFSAAKIQIGETTLVGHVELHLRTSDWEKHQHQHDPQYNNVILHVVYQHDQELSNNIPVLELEPRISTVLLERYNEMLHAAGFIPCQSSLLLVKELVWISWKERLLVERLTRKAAFIFSMLEENNVYWEETMWWMLARNFGMKVNVEAFEAIARTISPAILAKHKTSVHQIEALLFGQAGLLNATFEQEYPRMLQREYVYLQKKLHLKPISIPLQFLRMRPGNFPTVRLAQLAVLVQQSSHLFSTIIEAENLAEVRNLLQVTANEFWHYHYTFKQSSAYKPKTLGKDAVDNVIINTMIPLVFAFGLYHKKEHHKEKALRWLETIAAEKNAITKGFSDAGVPVTSAFDSQALIELKNEYCTARKCLSCAVGNFLLKKGRE